MNEWLKTGEDPVTYLYAGRYLLEEEPGCLLANQVLEDIEAGKRVIVDLEAGTHHIHHHFYVLLPKSARDFSHEVNLAI